MHRVSEFAAIVVSEETGRVSIARGGVMTRGIKIDRFKGIIRSIYSQGQKLLENSGGLLVVS